MLNTAPPGAPQLKAEFKSTFGESPAEREGALPDEYDPRNETYDKVHYTLYPIPILRDLRQGAPGRQGFLRGPESRVH